MKITVLAVLVVTIALFSACSAGSGTGIPIKTVSAGNGLTVKLSSTDGVLRDGANNLKLSFENENGQTVEIGSASLNFNMPAMGTMPEMNDAAILTTTGRPGVYDAAVKLQMAGEWIAQIAYEGPAGKGKITMTMSAQ